MDDEHEWLYLVDHSALVWTQYTDLGYREIKLGEGLDDNAPWWSACNDWDADVFTIMNWEWATNDGV